MDRSVVFGPRKSSTLDFVEVVQLGFEDVSVSTRPLHFFVRHSSDFETHGCSLCCSKSSSGGTRTRLPVFRRILLPSLEGKVRTSCQILRLTGTANQGIVFDITSNAWGISSQSDTSV